MKHRFVLPVLISLLLLNAITVVADVWTISRDGQNGIVHISKNGKVDSGLVASGTVRDIAITKDGAYLYVSYSDIGCGRVPPDLTCWGEGLETFDLRTKQGVLLDSDIPNPGKLVIDETDSFLYMTCGGCKNGMAQLGSIRKYDISKLPDGSRTFQLMVGTDLWTPENTSRVDVRQGAIALADKAIPVDENGNSIVGEFFWYVVYCNENTLWTYPGGAPSGVVGGLATNTDPSWGNYWVNDVMISPDMKYVFTASSVAGNTYQNGYWQQGNVVAFRGPAEEGYSGDITAVMKFGSGGVTRMVSVGTRFYAIAGDEFLYSGDFTGTAYNPLLIGGHLSGLAYDGDTLYVSEGDSRTIYPIKLGKTSSRDKIAKATSCQMYTLLPESWW